jgi:nucleotide-binding universal stress UspA family protein
VVHFYGGHPATELHDQLRSLGHQDLDEVLVADLKAAGEMLLSDRRVAGRAPRFSVVTQRAIPGIVHRLEAQLYDLVALGSHSRRGVARFVLGSVAETVARRAPCSVLVAKGGT